ncbi:MAG: ABC transporter permease [Gammaproteobacteria bacterium]|jgi:spermidine/putrescine transport system permease protein|uniref:Spermidine/putrescine transport system permease protein n=1 Tax=Marinomonas polaris DSM 16579 TaxID=1122206 RepID=A0A1M5BCJ9_9GAMM|nr:MULTISPECIES: ABC transporter permease [Marinomonas]MBU1295135.1 ABC transporter permease [Gammaproteobacteria bacterium]MBU1465429.1 ABC transporter permease [Gammaproteobacteria bacterium]MBU2021513.1 ABC transporter permease [Gammaproteobacteria bacterium]MBU2238979.1 ABC transporter permease [Gammaproteobacteria bacterium]MBU2319358.1 ABC transporter permease [Gammaproteobacteria bacterium]
MFSQLKSRFGSSLAVGIIGMIAIWLIGLVILPQILMVDYSFRPNLLPADIGGPNDTYSLMNYETLFSNKIHLAIFFKTIWSSVLVTSLTLVVSYPIAFYLAKVATPQKAALCLLLLIIPFWINEILRTFSWYIILAYKGPLNALLLGLGIIDRPIRFLSGDGGVLIGMVYAYILFMIFPIYNAIESLDTNQIKAARNLGAGWIRTHWRVVIPHAKPGIATGCIMTFMLAAGSYAVPALLGSPGSRWFTQIIYNWFFEGGDWNQGAAYAFLLLIICIGFIALVMRVFKVGLGDIAK